MTILSEFPHPIRRVVSGASAAIRRAAQGMTAQHQQVAMRIRIPLTRKPGQALWFPEDLNEDQLSTYPCDPEAPVAYTDQYRTLQANPVTITANPVQLALENRSRSEMYIVNVGIAGVLIAFGFVPTQTVFTLPLQACGSLNDGTGGIIINESWKGQVWAIVQSGQLSNGLLLFTELNK